MKTTLQALQQFVEIKNVTTALDQFLSLGFEATIQKGRRTPAGVLLGEVLAVSTHPKADRLQLTKVRVGERKVVTVVCGAKNVRVGMFAPFASVGVEIAGIKLTRREIRGVASGGMLLSERELFGEGNASELLELPRGTPGTPMENLYNEADLINLEIPPNRPDLLGDLGLARELAIKNNLRLRLPDVVTLPKLKPLPDNQFAHTKSFYALKLNVSQLKKTPQQISARLAVSGLEPIHPLVDVVNYVMLETGQPFHVYDADNFNYKNIRVGLTRKEETVTLLSKGSQTLKPDSLMVESKGVIGALAGIIGTSGTAITAKTSSLILECAVFESALVRKTSRQNNLTTQSALRSEKNPSIATSLWALQRCLKLLKEVTQYEVEEAGAYLKKADPVLIPDALETVVALSGCPITLVAAKALLKKVGCEFKTDCIVPPVHRTDLCYGADLSEEIARFTGYDTIPSVVYAFSGNPVIAEQEQRKDLSLDYVKNHLTGAGYQEIRTDGLVEKSIAGCLQIENPIGHRGALRKLLLESMLETLAPKTYQTAPQQLFEIGHVFSNQAESIHLCLLATVSLSTVKSDLQNLFLRQRHLIHYQPGNHPFFAKCVTILNKDDAVLGVGGILKKDMAPKRIGPITALEVDCAVLFTPTLFEAKPVSAYPKGWFDLSFYCLKPYWEINQELKSLPSGQKGINVRIALIDAYELAGKHSFTFRFVLSALDHTLTNFEIEAVRKTILSFFMKIEGITIR